MKNKSVVGFSRRFELALSLNPSSNAANPKETSYFDKPGRELGELFGVDKKTISNWRKLDIMPSGKKCVEMCVILDVGIAWLLVGAGAPRESRYNIEEIWMLESYRNLDRIGKNAAFNNMLNGDYNNQLDPINKAEGQRILELVTRDQK